MTETLLQRRFSDAEEFVAALLVLVEEKGGTCYCGEPINQLAHALQAAHLARQAGAEDSLIGAALLHDVGHLLITEQGANESPSENDHEKIGAQLLARWFAPAVAIPVALHVCAKRYLARVDPGYRAGLSLASQQHLQAQGGPLAPEPALQFGKLAFAQEAIWLCRWDDLAKRSGEVIPPLRDHFTLLLGLANRFQLNGYLAKATLQ